MVTLNGTMLADSDVKEQLSLAYVHAVAAHAGFSFTPSTVDRDSIDATIRARGRLAADSLLTSPALDLQLKASSVIEWDGNKFQFELSMKNYDDLRQMERALPTLLVVMVLPKDYNDWLVHDEGGLVARNCAYWVSLKGLEAGRGRRTKTITVPKKNVFSPQTLKQIMYKISKLEVIENDF